VSTGFCVRFELSGLAAKTTWALLLTAALLLTGCGDGTRVNMFEGTTTQHAMTELTQKIGHPAKTYDLEITPLSLAIRVQDPAKPSHIDEYKIEHHYALNNLLHHAAVTGPTPYQPNLMNNKLEENLFDLSEINLAAVAETAKAAVDRCGLEEGGVVESIHIQRHQYLLPKPSSGAVEWDIQVRSDRESANAYADAKGRIERLNLDGANRARNLDLYADGKELANVVGMTRDVFGKNPALSRMVVYQHYLSFQALDPKKPKRIMSFLANLNGVSMQLQASYNGRETAESRFFALDDADWSRLPEILTRAPMELQMPKGSVSLVTLEKPTFEGDALPLRWTVDVKDDSGEDGSAEFDAKGKLVHLNLPKSRRVHLSLFEPDGAAKAIVGIKERFGAHARLMELSFDEQNATVIAYNPKQPGRLRDFIYQEDAFLDYPGSDMTTFYRGFDSESFFDLDEIEAAFPRKLAQFKQTALERLRVPGAKIERITITRHPKMQQRTPKVTVEVRAYNGSDGGWVIFDLQGNIIYSNP
jgi:hypothetical protein